MMMGNLPVLAQVERLLARLTPEIYARPLKLFGEATLGQHFRHILDAYECLLRGLPAESVDYSSRRRQAELERDPALALQTLKAYRERLVRLDPDRPIELVADGDRIVQSSVARELLHARDHTIHHLAIIRIGLTQAFPDFELDAELGVAPSTLAHRRGAR